MSIRFLHFSDLHLDHSLNGRRDPDTGLPLRVTDILKNLDMVVDHAIRHVVDFVLFSGDAYHTHMPRQEYKELFHQRIMQLAHFNIPVVLVVGNHDRIKRSTARNALHEFKSLDIEGVHVFDEPGVLKMPGYQIVALPWQYGPVDIAALPVDFSRPAIVGAHATVWGAEYQTGSEATSESALGHDFVLTVEELEAFDYVGLGHIHRPQVLCEDPPIIYPGSVGYHTWGEAHDSEHGFIEVRIDYDRNVTWNLIPYEDRLRYDITVDAASYDDVLSVLPEEVDPEGMYRVTINWAERNKAGHLVEQYLKDAFHVQVRERSPRLRSRESVLPSNSDISREELLETYYGFVGEEFDEETRTLWQSIVEKVEEGG